jgi:hypothetical protein
MTAQTSPAASFKGRHIYPIASEYMHHTVSRPGCLGQVSYEIVSLQEGIPWGQKGAQLFGTGRMLASIVHIVRDVTAGGCVRAYLRSIYKRSLGEDSVSDLFCHDKKDRALYSFHQTNN